MEIKISIEYDLGSDECDLIYSGELEGGFSIDYALNALVSYRKGKEVILYDFSPYLKLDNRFSGYNIKVTVSDIIIIFN